RGVDILMSHCRVNNHITAILFFGVHSHRVSFVATLNEDLTDHSAAAIITTAVTATIKVSTVAIPTFIGLTVAPAIIAATIVTIFTTIRWTSHSPATTIWIFFAA